jgi:hypothetical protein
LIDGEVVICGDDGVPVFDRGLCVALNFRGIMGFRSAAPYMKPTAAWQPVKDPFESMRFARQ